MLAAANPDRDEQKGKEKRGQQSPSELVGWGRNWVRPLQGRRRGGQTVAEDRKKMAYAHCAQICRCHRNFVKITAVTRRHKRVKKRAKFCCAAGLCNLFAPRPVHNITQSVLSICRGTGSNRLGKFERTRCDKVAPCNLQLLYIS